MTDLMNSIAGVDLGLSPGLTKNTGVPTTDAAAKGQGFHQRPGGPLVPRLR